MSVVKIPDASGNTFKCVRLEDGRLYPTFDIDVLKNVQNLKLRDDDIFICNYPKSGTHWLFEIVLMLRLNTVDVPYKSKGEFMIDFWNHETLDAKPSPRPLNSHFRFQYLPTDIHVKKPKILYIRRNPKDVAVSFYNHVMKFKQYYEYNGTFRDYLGLFVQGKVDYGSWFEYVKEWEQVCQNSDVPILQLTYEQLKKDTLGEIRKINDFLGLERTEELCKKIKEAVSFDKMSKRKGNNPDDEDSVIYRKGEVGDWKNWFSQDDVKWFDEIYKENMVDSKLEFVYEL